MNLGKPFHHFSAYGETVVSLLGLGLASAAMYGLIRVGCADLFKWLMGN